LINLDYPALPAQDLALQIAYPADPHDKKMAAPAIARLQVELPLNPKTRGFFGN